MEVGIVGLPNVGKSTLFNALTSNQAEASNYPFCTIEPNVGIVEVPDERLQKLAELSGSEKILYAIVRFIDIAGIVKGASEGEGLGNKFLSHIREVDACIQMVRCFESEDIVHVAGEVNPLADIDVIATELCLADLQMIKGMLPKIEKEAKLKKELKPRLDALHKLDAHLNEGKPVRTADLTPEEREQLKGYSFITNKPTIYLANVSEADLPEMDNEYVRQVKKHAESEGSIAIPICAKLEEEIANLPVGERAEFLESLGLKQSGLQRLVKEAYRLLGLITYLTTGPKETRAWTITNGTNAALAAGKIHTDIQKGFIRAEVVAYNDMLAYKGKQGARAQGKVRSEGKDYIVKDGDVIEFMHHG